MSDGEIVWTEEARRRVENAPAFVRPGILKLMERRARERGRTVITSEFLTEIRNESMLRVAKCIKGFGFEELSMEAFEVAKTKMRKLPRKVEVIEEIKAFLVARTQKNEMVLAKFQRYLETIPDRGLPWTEEALARLQRAPAFVRELGRGTPGGGPGALRDRACGGAIAVTAGKVSLMGDGGREFFVTRAEWQSTISQAQVLNAYRQRPVGQWPYVWGVKGPSVLLRWYDYAMGRVSGEEAGNGRVRCTLLILGCTGEIKNPAAYARLKEQFFSELLERPVRVNEGR